MELVDTHCHIQSAGRKSGGERTTRGLWAKHPDLTGDAMITSAKAAGVTRLIVVGCDLEDSQLATDFVETRKGCWAAIGLHPHEAKHYANQTNLLRQFTDLVFRPKVVAIGECGLDYYYNHSPKEDQRTVLRYQIEVALRSNLPLIFHVREAFDDFWPIFDAYPGLRGVLHSYTDSTVNLQKALERNLLIGVNGIATFVKKPQQLDVYRSIPLEQLVLETDAPFLTPQPHRGTINQPKQIATIADFMADLLSVTREELANVTTDNARKLFAI